MPYAKEILVFDTGSTDKTVEIIKSTHSPKIIFEEKGVVNKEGLTKLREEQIKRTKTDWFLIVDGDEIWPANQIGKLLKIAEDAPQNTTALFNRVRNCIGDVYHYLPENTGKYEIKGIKGNLNIRLIRNRGLLKVQGNYPLEYYEDDNGPIQNQKENLIFADVWYLHTTFLKRSSNQIKKVSGSFGKQRVWERGLIMKEDELPEVFSLPKPEFLPNPLVKRSVLYEVASLLTIPAVSLKRRFR